ncbi:MAG: hypothetical protein EOO33_10705, partial [Comamonadaceae bacterium]
MPRTKRKSNSRTGKTATLTSASTTDPSSWPKYQDNSCRPRLQHDKPFFDNLRRNSMKHARNLLALAIAGLMATSSMAMTK